MGCGVVTTSGGCTREYFGELAYYCDRFEPTTIMKAVEDAWKGPKSAALSNLIREKYNWDAAAKATKAAYEATI